MGKLEWLKELDDQDLRVLLDKDMKLVFEYCDIDTLIDLLENIPGIQLYTSRRSVERAQQYYILENFEGDNHKELAAKINCSMDFVYKTIRSYKKSDQKPDSLTPDLFKKEDKS